MSRLHPFELVFAQVADAWFAPVRAEAEQRGRDPLDRSIFAALEAVQGILDQLTEPGVAERDPEAAGEYLLLAHAAYAFWQTGRRTVRLTRDQLEPALDAETTNLPSVPQSACYVQLPERWFWGQVKEGEPHEPIDGLFVVRGGGGEFTVTAILGLREDRGGFSQLGVTATADDFVAAAGEIRRPAFAPLMAGGSLAGFRSIASMAELLWLTHLALGAAGE